MIKFGTERPAETVYPTLYDEFEISKRPYWLSPAAKERTSTTFSLFAFIKRLSVNTQAKPTTLHSNLPTEALDKSTDKP
jgi:hypothetical protein